MKSVYFYTLGCRVNQYETEAMRSAFMQLGFKSEQQDSQADICILNSCSVTAESDRKCRNQIRRIRRNNPNAFLVVTGCYATGSRDVVESMPEVDQVVPSKGKDPKEVALEVLETLGFCCPEEAGFHSPITTFAEHTRAFIKIEDGCNQMCTYCRIPFYRGRARSRPKGEILEEIQALSEEGYTEVVLCGIQLGAYGRDIQESLPELLQQIDAIPSIQRCRLSSIEPDDVTPLLIETLVSLPSSVPHLHLPLQSGDNGVLSKMGRRYTYEDYLDLIGRLCQVNPEFAVSTDLMVGFPGEDEPAFENSVRAIREVEFCRLHIFRFSERPGTRAASFPDKVPREAINRRRAELGRVADEVVDRVRQRQMGRILRVLLEEPGPEPNTAVGFSENYLRVQVGFENGATGLWKALLGQLVDVEIQDRNAEYLLGQPVSFEI